MKLKFKSITNPIARFSSLALMAGVCLSVLALRAEDCAHANKEHLSTQEPTGEKFLDRLRADPRVISGTASPYATGGDLVLKDGDDYIHVFYNTAAAGTLSVTGEATADILVVGGGACGGSVSHTSSIDSGAGGGGAGGVTILSATALAAGSYAVTVGAGGTWAAAVTKYANGNGGASSFGELATAHGGGIGARYKVVANGSVNVACGGGGNGYYNNTTYNKGGATAYPSEGCAGGDSQCNDSSSSSKLAGGGGGGGAGAVGGTGVVNGAGGAGGDGKPCAILGGDFSSQVFGGGGGASVPGVEGAAGGLGGGGKAGTASGSVWTESCVGEAGENGLGGGGGAGCGVSTKALADQPSGDGGSGIVIVRLKGSTPKITPPTAKTGLLYTGEEQTGVEEGAGYTLTGNKGTNADDYTAVATLTDKTGTTWDDGSTDDREIPWSIAKAMPSITGTLVMPGWTEGQTPSEPSGLSTDFGEIVYRYYANSGCTEAIAKPTTKGTYWVRGEVAADANWYAANSAAVSFAIKSVGPAKVQIPTAKTGLAYTGAEQTGVPEGEGYTLTGHKGRDANTYTATASLIDQSGDTKWSDDTTTDKPIEWTIAKGANAWQPAPSITLNRWAIDGKPGVLTPGRTKFGSVTATIAKNGDAPGPFSGTTLPKEVGEYVITYTAPAATANYTAPDETTKSVQFTIVEYEFTAIDPPYFSSARTFKHDGTAKTVTLAGFDGATMTKETESVESAADAGIYKVYVTPKAGYGWRDIKTTATRALEWGIVASDYVDDRNFLISLANSRNRVNATALPPGISGGDILLRFQNEAGLSYDFVHIYTNTAASGFVFNNDSGEARPGRVLIVGGGGAGGTSSRTAWDGGQIGGGGGGGGVVSMLGMSLDGSYAISVGSGAASTGQNGADSSLSGSGLNLLAYGGGAGGSANSSTAYNGANGGSGGGSAHSDSQEEGTPGASLDPFQGGVGFSAFDLEDTDKKHWWRGGAGGGAGSGQTPTAQTRLGGNGFVSDILTDGATYHCFGGGGSSGIHENNGGKTDGNVSAPLGGGGYTRSPASASHSSQIVSPSVAGLGAGGMGQNANHSMRDPKGDMSGSSGIVIVRYTDTVRAPKIKTVAVPEVPSFVFNYQVHDTGIRDTEDYTVSDDVTGLYIQEYTITLTLRDPDNMQWDDGTIQPQHIKWYVRSDNVDSNSDADRFLYGLSTNHNRVAIDQLQIGADIILGTRFVRDSVEYIRYALVYTNNQSITLPQSFSGNLLLVGGGGGGGKGGGTNRSAGGGGGGGGVREEELVGLAAGTYSVTVGKGGAGATINYGNGGAGGSTSLVGPDVSYEVGGGGYGGGEDNPGGDAVQNGGGGGGAGAHIDTSAAGGQYGFAGGKAYDGGSYYSPAAAGGGAGQIGESVADGQYTARGGDGKPLTYNVLGDPLYANQYFGGGGGGGGGGTSAISFGGKGGGGDSHGRSNNSTPGLNGLGGGGAGGSDSNSSSTYAGTPGGDGIVILAYEIEAGKMVKKPLLTVDRFTYSGETITAKDYLTSLEHIVVTGKDAAVNVGSYTFTVALEEGYLWTDGGNEPVSFEWMIVAKPIQGNVTVPAIPVQVYTGSPITPSFQVFDTARDVVLTPGTDYTAEYNGNVNIGTATIKLTGKGNYTGNEWTTFQIVANPDEQGYYVTPDATDGDGTGWDTPATLANALTLAQSSGKPVTIYALEGTYEISSPCTLANPGQDVRIMGGYTGTGLARGQNFSVLDGAGASALLSLTSDHAITLQQLQLMNSTAAVTKGGSGALTVTRCLFDHNSDAAALQVSAGSAAVENCTFAENAAGSVAQTGGAVTVRNSILWNSSRTAEVSGTVTFEYVLVPDGESVTGTGVIHGDPLFVSDDDFHLKSTAGHYTPSGWVEDAVSSPAIDAGDPAADCSAEPKNAEGQNFGLNLGVYGNTAHASKSPEVKLAYDLHAITATGPLVKGIPATWLEAAFPGIVEPTQAAYQAAFLTKNGNDVTAWAAYILGFAGEEVASAAIIEKATQSEMTEDGQTVALTIDLPDLPPESKRPTVAGCTVSYSLLMNTYANALREGNGTIVEGCEKIGKLPFSAPLDFTSGHAYYRIRVHFSFKGE